MGNGSHVTIEAVILIACFHMGKNVYVLLRSVQSIVIDSKQHRPLQMPVRANAQHTELANL